MTEVWERLAELAAVDVGPNIVELALGLLNVLQTCALAWLTARQAHWEKVRKPRRETDG